MRRGSNENEEEEDGFQAPFKTPQSKKISGLKPTPLIMMMNKDEKAGAQKK